MYLKINKFQRSQSKGYLRDKEGILKGCGTSKT